MTKTPTQARIVQVDGYPTPPLVRWMNDSAGRLSALEAGAAGFVLEGGTATDRPGDRLGLDGGTAAGLPDLGDPIYESRYQA